MNLLHSSTSLCNSMQWVNSLLNVEDTSLKKDPSRSKQLHAIIAKLTETKE